MREVGAGCRCGPDRSGRVGGSGCRRTRSRLGPRSCSGPHATCLAGADRDLGFNEGLRQVGLELSSRNFALRTDNQLAQLAALRVGLGIGVCQVPLARRAPVLQRVLPQISFHLEFWVVTHEDLKGSARVRAVFDQLVRRLATYLTP